MQLIINSPSVVSVSTACETWANSNPASSVRPIAHDRSLLSNFMAFVCPYPFRIVVIKHLVEREGPFIWHYEFKMDVAVI